MDITLHFILIVVGGLFVALTGKRARFEYRLRYIKRTQGRRAAWEWYMTTPQWRKTRRATFKAFYWRCAECGSPNNLQAHHRTKEAYEKYLGHEKPIRDLTALCAPCHAKAPRSGGLYRL